MSTGTDAVSPAARPLRAQAMPAEIRAVIGGTRASETTAQSSSHETRIAALSRDASRAAAGIS
jgi:hypothetical protein